jgi:hypothetical protein
MDGSSDKYCSNIENERDTSTPIAVILGCTMVIERGMVVFT